MQKAFNGRQRPGIVKANLLHFGDEVCVNGSNDLVPTGTVPLKVFAVRVRNVMAGKPADIGPRQQEPSNIRMGSRHRENAAVGIGLRKLTRSVAFKRKAELGNRKAGVLGCGVPLIDCDTAG
ncbi:hypothetical protein SDC9_68108 [bioreactor metagenome]|uniref:Uncharacterized protein n=1 Tax=bioreactor metagenome TaxID=1076179 RepID=A0A644Y520_9ZZZZ